MTYAGTTGKTIQESFDEYHQLNPHVYEHFKRLAFDAIRKGKKKISFKLILNKIRWDVYIQTEEPTLFSVDGKIVKWKINDAYHSRYARLFIKDYPEYSDIIELRELRS